MTRVKKRLAWAFVSATVIFALLVISPNHSEPRLVVITSEDETLAVSTTATLVADILTEAGITLDEKYEISYPAPREELKTPYITIRRAARVTLKVDGEEREVTTWAKNIDELLREQAIVIGDDLVSLPLEQTLVTGMQIEVVRVERALVSQDVAITAKITYKQDSSLDLGKEKVLTPARDGKKHLTYEIIYRNGQEVARNLVSEEIIAPAVAGIVLKGTRASVSRGGDTAVVGIASYYGAELHGNRTASGTPFDMYALTAAHKTLPFGTKVRVTLISSGRSVVVRINDRGPYIAGRIIDLSAAAAKEIGLYSVGIGKVRLEVLN